MPTYREIYEPVAREIARRYGVPEDLFVRLITIESGWNPWAVSPAGAIGLGQLMPGTARGLGVDPWNPVQNLEGAARYLRQNFDRFGNWVLAAAAYNAGPGAVQQYGGVPPFAETQRYINLLFGGAPPPAATGPSVPLDPNALRPYLQAYLDELRRRFTPPGIDFERLSLNLDDVFRGGGLKVPPPRVAFPLSAADRVTQAMQTRRRESAQEAVRRAVEERLSALSPRAASNLVLLSTLEESLGVTPMQLGGLVDRMTDVFSQGAQAVGQALGEALSRASQATPRPVRQAVSLAMKPFELEQEYIGRPLARAAITPLRPVLPERAERVAEEVLSNVLVPSNFLPWGEVFRLARLGRFGGMLAFTTEEAARLAARGPRIYLPREAVENALRQAEPALQKLRELGDDAKMWEASLHWKPVEKMGVDALLKEMEKQGLENVGFTSDLAYVMARAVYRAPTGEWRIPKATLPTYGLTRAGWLVHTDPEFSIPAPKTVYHTTANVEGVSRARMLLASAGEEGGGLGAGVAPPHVSVTLDRGVAELLARDIATASLAAQARLRERSILGPIISRHNLPRDSRAAAQMFYLLPKHPDVQQAAREVARNLLSVYEDMGERWGRPAWWRRMERRKDYLGSLLQFARRVAEDPTSVDVKDVGQFFLFSDMVRLGPWDTFQLMLNTRQSAGGPINPIIYWTPKLAEIDPDKIAILEIPFDNLVQGGGLLTSFDVGVTYSLQEVRHYGDLPLGEGVRYLKPGWGKPEVAVPLGRSRRSPKPEEPELGYGRQGAVVGLPEAGRDAAAGVLTSARPVEGVEHTPAGAPAPAQLGRIVEGVGKALGDVKETVGQGVLSGLERIGDYLEWEQERIGRPVTRAVGRVFSPLEPVVPDPLERFFNLVGETTLTPSSLALTLLPVGRVATVGRLLIPTGANVLAGRMALSEAANASRLALRQMFAPSTMQAARALTARRLGIPLEQLVREMPRRPDFVQAVLSAEQELKEAARVANPIRLLKAQRKLSREVFDLETELLFPEMLPEVRANPRGGRLAGVYRTAAWWQTLIDKAAVSRLPDAQVNFLTRLFDPKKVVPLLDRPLGELPVVGGAISDLWDVWTRVVQPVARVDSRLRPRWIHAANIGRAWAQHAEVRKQTVLRWLEGAFGRDAVRGAPVKGIEYIGPPAAERFGGEGAEYVVGTLVDIMHHPEYYRGLSDYQLEVIRRAQNVLDLDRLEAVQAGVSIGEVMTAYVPHRLRPLTRLAPADLMAVEDYLGGLASNPRFARSFRRRQYEWDELVQLAREMSDRLPTALREGPRVAVETDIERLLDWRLGHAARKKTEQYFLRLLARDPSLSRLVHRRTVAFTREVVDPATGQVRRETVVRKARELSLKSPEDILEPELRDVARQAHALMSSRFSDQGAAAAVDRVVDFLRAIRLTFDLSPLTLVQGVRIFSADPLAWLAMARESATWLFTQEGKRLWALHNLPNVTYWTERGLALGVDNIFDINTESLLRFGPTRPFMLPIAAINRHLMDAVNIGKLYLANTMLSTLLLARESPEVLDLVRSLPWVGKALSKMKVPLSAASEDDIARAVAEGLNNAIGPVNFNLVTPQGRSSFLERFVLLTPSWTRGNIGTIANAVKVGPKGLVARWLLANQLALAAFLAQKLSLALSGEDTNLDPTASDFLAVKTPWGRFSVIPSLAIYRYVARIVAGRPGDRDEIDTRFADVLRLWESRLGIGPRIAIDLMTGEDFLGRRVDPMQHYVMRQFLPIVGDEAFQTVTEGVPAEQAVERLAIQALGGSYVPKTPFQLARDRLEELTGLPAEEIDNATRQRLYAQDPVLRELRERQQFYRRQFGDPVNQFFLATTELRQGMQEAMNLFLQRADRSDPLFYASYARLAGELLQQRAQLAEAHKLALWETPEEAEKALRERAQPGQLRDEKAVEYWSQRPNLEACNAYAGEDYETCIEQMWHEFRRRRETILAGVDEATRRYILEEFPAARWDDPQAKELEIRRVRAQMDAARYFETPRYRLPDGTPMPPEVEAALTEVRQEVNMTIVNALRTLRERGITVRRLPSGAYRRILLAMLQATPAEDTVRRTAIAFELLWRQPRLQPLLRNPERYRIALQNPDIVLFYPDTVGRSLPREVLLQLPQEAAAAALAAGA